MTRTSGLLLALGAFVSCTRPSAPSIRDVLVIADASPAEFRSGDTTAVRVTVSNRSRQPVTIATDGCDRFLVRNMAGAIVGPTRYCSLMERYATLQPGESTTLESRWRGENRDGTGRVAPGTYELRGRVRVASSVIEAEPRSIVILPE